MSVQGLGIRAVHKIESATDLHILRAVINNGGNWRIWWFTTDNHEHGWYDRTTDQWELDESIGHFSPMCDWLFNGRPRDDSWGRVCGDGRWHVSTRGADLPDGLVTIAGTYDHHPRSEVKYQIEPIDGGKRPTDG